MQECICVLEPSRKLFFGTNVRVLCLTLRKWGNRGRQCWGEGERSLPAHYRQSADAFRTVTQTGATCLNGAYQCVCVCDIEDAMNSKMPRTRTFTATRSLYQQRCHVDYRVPYVLTCLPFKGFDTKRVIYKTAHALWTVYQTRFCEANWDFPAWDGVKEAVISVYSIYWTEHAPCFCSCDEVLVIY